MGGAHDDPARHQTHGQVEQGEEASLRRDIMGRPAHLGQLLFSSHLRACLEGRS